MAVPPSEPAPAGKVPNPIGRNSEKKNTPVSPAAQSDETTLLAFLRDLVSSGTRPLDSVLAGITEAAQGLTGASGAAIAMWRNGKMVCRARSGEIAPALGAELDAKAGISGECLRTGVTQLCPDTENHPHVNVEVCRALGLRSIAVLPIRGWRGTNGILEVFSAVPGAFTERQLALLADLAALAERARALQPQGASHFVVREHAEEEKPRVPEPRPPGILPASDRVGDVALAAVGGRRRRVVIWVLGVAAIVLVALAIWLGWRGPDQNEANPQAASPAASPAADARPQQPHLPDNDPVWKPNPGGEPVFPSNQKTDSASAVTLASRKDVIAMNVGGATKPSAGTLLSSPKASSAVPPAKTQSSAATASPVPSSAPPASNENTTASLEAPAISIQQDGSSALGDMLSSNRPAPELSAPISQGVSGGRLLNHVDPSYPAQAITRRIEGRVVLSAIVSEDGTVAEMKVVAGPAELAQSAMGAVKRWRYQPFLLDGKPIRQKTTITIDFKLPAR